MLNVQIRTLVRLQWRNESIKTVIHSHRDNKFLMTCLRVVAIVAVALFTMEASMADNSLYRLPEPIPGFDNPLNPILQQRRTHREFAPQGVSLTQVTQLLWAAQGVTSREGYRTAPSAGALYPLELHLIAGQVEGLPNGSYRYDTMHHSLQSEKMGDLRKEIAAAALHQDWIEQAPAIVVISAYDARTTKKYGSRGLRYVHMEVGHASQNLLLQAVALGLAAATVGAFDDERLQQLLGLTHEERPLVIHPVGYPR
jgi:SagB-type dehydrogenase family enzyme